MVYPSATFWNTKDRQEIEAAIQLHKGKFDEAIRILGPARPVEMGTGRDNLKTSLRPPSNLLTSHLTSHKIWARRLS